MNIAIATIRVALVGVVASLVGVAAGAQAQTPASSPAGVLDGVQERSIQTTSFTSQRSYTTEGYGQPETDKAVGIKLDQNLQLQVNAEREALPIGAYPADDNAKGNRVQLIYQLDESTLPLR